MKHYKIVLNNSIHRSTNSNTSIMKVMHLLWFLDHYLSSDCRRLFREDCNYCFNFPIHLKHIITTCSSPFSLFKYLLLMTWVFVMPDQFTNVRSRATSTCSLTSYICKWHYE